MRWMREVEETGSEEDQGEVRGEGREERLERQTLQDEALDLFTQETHKPGHQHTSASRSDDDSVVTAAVPRSDPCCCHGTPLDENGIR
jgi:hypothetical protein